MKRCLLLALLVLLVSCSQSTSPPNSQEAINDVPEAFLGAFYCSGHEAGLLAFAGNLTIRADGSVALEWMYAGTPLEGSWRYDSASAQLTFSTDMEISHALYNDAADSLQVYLREGVERAHVEMGVMSCQKQ